MKGKLIDLVLYGGCLLLGLMIGDGIGSRVNDVDKSINSNAKKIEQMQLIAAQIDIKMALVLEQVKRMDNNK